MTGLFVPIAFKSIVVAAVVLGVLKLAASRSASDRSWIAHLGLAAILLLPLATIAMPSLDVAGPSFLTKSSDAIVEAPVASGAPIEFAADPEAAASLEAAAVPAVAAPIDWMFWAYAVPAGLLILLTLVALGRLVPLKARANVLVEPHWLTALARAQRRMGFKHGTALLTSEDLPSPISWGLVRPVILLNSDAADSHEQAEAIIAHELAHVAHLDWVKLLVARVTVALFWFNPLVWLLAREAHQLREEAADDAVLASDIEDTDYARLLVGVARHECRGMLIGAHGVAPGKNSLTRRVRRVLDGALSRAPGGWRWSSAAAIFAAGMAVPVAALNFVPTTPREAGLSGDAIAVRTDAVSEGRAPTGAEASIAASAAQEADLATKIVERQMDAAMSDVDKAVASAVAGAAAATATSDRGTSDLVNAQIHGVTPKWIASMRAASPALARASLGDFVDLRIHGVTPAYVRSLDSGGLRGLTASQLQTAAIHGVSGEFLRSMAALGYPRLTYAEAVNMRIHGVNPNFVREVRRAGARSPTARDLIKLRIQGFGSDDGSNDVDADVDIDEDDGG